MTCQTVSIMVLNMKHIEINPTHIWFVSTNQLSYLIKAFSPEQGTSGIDGLQVNDFYSVDNLDIGKFEIVLPHVVFCWFNTLKCCVEN